MPAGGARKVAGFLTSFYSSGPAYTKSFRRPRIGGATDIGDTNPLMLQAKGRWGSDIARIYNRLTRRGLVEASRAMHRHAAKDMEELSTMTPLKSDTLSDLTPCVLG